MMVITTKDGSKAGGFIIDSYADVAVESYHMGATHTGGLVGNNNAGTIIGSHALGHVRSAGTLGSSAGGLAGTNSGKITSSYATGSVWSTGETIHEFNIGGLETWTGGLVGVNRGNRGKIGEIDRCHATGPVLGNGLVGGLVGRNLALVTASYATGDVWGRRAGGLTGGNAATTATSAGEVYEIGVIAASYATGNVTGGYSGGLAGLLAGGTILSSYATGAVTSSWSDSPKGSVGGLTGYVQQGRLKKSTVDSRVSGSYSISPVSGESSRTGGLVGYSSQLDAFSNSYWDTQATSVGVGKISNSTEQSLAGAEGKALSELQSPAGYTGIYANWRLDVDNLDEDNDPGTGADDVWDFGSGSQYPVLKVDYDGDGTATWQEFGEQPRSGPAAPSFTIWHEFPEWPDLELVLPVPNGKYDADADGLIEITYLEQLDAIRHDLEGNGVANDPELKRYNRDWMQNPGADAATYAAAFPTAAGEPVCRQRCRGFELARSLDFKDPASYASGQVNSSWTEGVGWASLGTQEIYIYVPFGGGRKSRYVSRFETVFEGNGHTISNLHIDGPEKKTEAETPVGLFGTVSTMGRVRNTGLVDAEVTAPWPWQGKSTGVLVSINRGIISNSHVTGSLKADGGGNLGGLVGRNLGEIRDSYASVTISALRENVASVAGGLIGFNRGLVRDSYADGSVFGSDAGGLVASNYGIVLRCHALGPVTGSTSDVGGLTGGARTIIASYATGDATGQSEVAGLGNSKTINASYSISKVSGDRQIRGLGLVWSNRMFLRGSYPDLMITSYWDTDVSGVAINDPRRRVAKWNGVPMGAEGMSTAELQGPTGYTGIYADWDLDLDYTDWDGDPKLEATTTGISAQPVNTPSSR